MSDVFTMYSDDPNGRIDPETLRTSEDGTLAMMVVGELPVAIVPLPSETADEYVRARRSTEHRRQALDGAAIGGWATAIACGVSALLVDTHVWRVALAAAMAVAVIGALVFSKLSNRVPLPPIHAVLPGRIEGRLSEQDVDRIIAADDPEQAAAVANVLVDRRLVGVKVGDTSSALPVLRP